MPDLIAELTEQRETLKAALQQSILSERAAKEALARIKERRDDCYLALKHIVRDANSALENGAERGWLNTGALLRAEVAIAKIEGATQCAG